MTKLQYLWAIAVVLLMMVANVFYISKPNSSIIQPLELDSGLYTDTVTAIHTELENPDNLSYVILECKPKQKCKSISLIELNYNIKAIHAIYRCELTKCTLIDIKRVD